MKIVAIVWQIQVLLFGNFWNFFSSTFDPCSVEFEDAEPMDMKGWLHYFSNRRSNKDCCCCLVAKSCSTFLQAYGLYSLGSSVSGIFQARILEWIAISFSRGSSSPRNWTYISCIGRWVLYHWATRKVQ